ncbi:MAG: signal peptidase II [Bacilli bacterium]|nr:signal peptidase II [Bacilli bacterium]
MKKNIYWLTIILLCIDQSIKVIVTKNMLLLKSITIIPNFFNITYVENPGGAWSILSSNTFLLTIISAIVLIGLNIYLSKKEKYSKLEIISYGLIMPGVLGNFIDRLINNAVIDYLDFKIFNYNFPIFNFADILIVCGIAIMMLEILIEERGIKNASRKQNN